jgi:hypothetical protein
MKLYKRDANPRKELHMNHYSTLQFEFMNGVVAFKRQLQQEYMKDEFRIADDVAHYPPFRAFFSLLPKGDSATSIDKMMQEDKKERERIVMQRQLTDAVQLCPRCNYNISSIARSYTKCPSLSVTDV